MSSLLSAELSATCNALGAFDKRTGKYLIDEFTINTVKDLVRYLRRDGEEHEIRIHFGQTKVLQTDLLPMLIDHWENTELFDVTLRLLVNLTNPALLLYNEEVPIERTARHNYLQILSHLQSYKEDAFTKVENWNMFAKKLTKVLEIDWSERHEDTGLIIERILILIRNVLHVPADLDHERRPDNDASVHDQVLWALNQSGILDIIIYMSSENEKQYFMHILEIISHLLREQNPTSLADAALQRSAYEKARDEQELLSMRSAETMERNNKIKQYSSTRHSRFGGTYVVQNMKSISDNDLISLKPLTDVTKLEFGFCNKKEKFAKPKNRRPVESGTMERRSAFAIRLFLKEFCIEFLNGSYNPLMRYVKDVLVRAKAQQNDESYYLWAVKFFMEFNRGHDFQVGLVSETMSVPMFHYVQQQMEKYLDMIRMEKKKFGVWVRRLHLSLRCYKELLHTLLAMEKSTDQTVKDSAKVLKSNIFYVLEYREFVLMTFLTYDENKMPRSYLIDLLETVHLFLKMLEHYCKKTGLVVQKKVRKKAKSKKKKPAPKKSAPKPQMEVPPWEEVRAQIAAAMSDTLDEHPPPFDAASDVPIDEQKEICMKNIQKLMREYKFEDSLGMFRAAREVWPEGIFGEEGINEVEELKMMESIYRADLGVELTVESNNETINEEQFSGDEDDEEEDEEDTHTSSVVETDFDFQSFVERFCQPRVVSACVFLLERYDKNLAHTNHCITKMLHRIAFDCKKPSMLFQATLFLVFQRVLHNPAPIYKEIEKFAIYIFRKFTEIASNNPKVFIELLFWKSSKETYDIEHGYDLYSDKVSKVKWTEEQEAELTELYMENQRNPTTDKDVIDWILENLIDQTRTRRAVIKKLKDLGLIFGAPTKKSNVKEKVPKEFGEDEDEALRDLWNTYSETNDPMGPIIARMPRKRAKQSYIDRLLELGIIDDKKQCRKKRSNKANGKSQSDDDSGDSASDSNASDSDDSGRSVSPKPKKVVKTSKKKKPQIPTITASEVGKLLIEAVDKDMTEALTWLAENIEEVALDQEAEGFDPQGEGIPIVPITTASVEAMDNRLFHRILYGIGIQPPSDEQETYWRIPSSLHFNTLRSRKEIITRAIDKTLIIEEETMNTIVTHEEESNDDDLFENLRKMRDNNEATVMKSDNGEALKSNSVKDKVMKTKIIKDKVKKTNYRKRSRSVEPEGPKRSKIARIEEENDEDDDDDDILSFAKKTLEQDPEEINTEDILGHLRGDEQVSNKDVLESDDEDILPAKRNQKRRLVIEDDSD